MGIFLFVTIRDLIESRQRLRHKLGALRVCPQKSLNLVSCDVFCKGAVESTIRQGTPQAQHTVTVDF